MKSTIKITPSKSITVEPCIKGTGIIATISLEMLGIKTQESVHLTPDQCGALLFGIEQALNEQEGIVPMVHIR